MVIPLYAGLCGLILLGLSLRVSRYRRRRQVGVGDGGFADLQLAIRTQGNFIEYAPLVLLLLALLELAGRTPAWALHGFGAALVIGRVLHAQGLLSGSGVSPGRMIGALLTWLVLLIASLLNIAGVLGWRF